jgi:hypothetical protein
VRTVRCLVLFGVLGAPTFAWADTVSARVVALDQPQTYNRFGAFNPVGMMYALARDVVDVETGASCADVVCTPGMVELRPDLRPRPLVLRVAEGDRLEVTFTNLLDPERPSPNAPSTRTASLHVNGLQVDGPNGEQTISPGATTTYTWEADAQGTFLFYSHGAVAGGEGGGGSLVLGLFGSVNVEPPGSRWYRSQVTADDLALATAADGSIDYAATYPLGHRDAGLPILAMLDGTELVRGDVNAIIADVDELDDGLENTTEGDFREFTVLFHDELKTIQAFDRLENDETFHGVRDAFGINYGSSGLGSILLAAQAGIGPAADCPECKFEEFFLTSWANGDPALLAEFEDDPSNVFHSYLNDRVKMRNLHAGPKETHVFHLHAHQWTATNDSPDSVYRDSQSIGPGAAFTYEINYGGGGNRNKTLGDSILHCHLYPHFASGMWGLWRVHDVFEDGTRRLPDGELGPGTDPFTGVTDGGAPIPGLVPMPSAPRAPDPVYGDPDEVAGVMPGYPFYIAGIAGHRPPQPPLDLVRDAGLPRHVVLAGEVGPAARGEFDKPLVAADLRILPDEGTPLELAAMDFHAESGHPTRLPTEPATAVPRFVFTTNGRPPAPGAPYADPCPADAPVREYDVSAIQLDGVVNRAGWHDPQMRMLALDRHVDAFTSGAKPPEPLFFRANSGECIVFRLTNRLPDALEEDDFQVFTPTDVVGQHIHLVKFDVTSSDGSANGWNYEDGALAAAFVEELIAAANAPDGSAVDLDGNPFALGPAHGFQTNVQRWWADPLLNAAGKDRTLRTVFTHDHLSPSSHQHHGYYAGLIIEPAGSTWTKPDGSVLTGGVGMAANIIDADDPVTHPDAREFAVALADFAIVYDSSGRPVNPPDAPEVISAADPGTMLVNYRNEPLPLRLALNGDRSRIRSGKAGDPAFVFSSDVHGDPFTTTFKAFEGDNVRLAIVQGAQEEAHVFTMHGMRWLAESGVPLTELISAQPIGISEHFESEVGLLGDVAPNRAFVDRLYGTTSLDDLWNGMWGLLRTFSTGRAIDPATGRPVALAPLPGADARLVVRNAREFDGPCPVSAPRRSYEVEAWEAAELLGDPGGIVYNQTTGLIDPSGLVYVDKAHLSAGKWPASRPLEPLVLRAAAGDCIEVKLTNRLSVPVADLAGDARVPPITNLRVDDLKVSAEVGITPREVTLFPTKGGDNMGYNGRSTAAPGETVTYRWYAGTVTFVRVRGRNAVDRVATPVAFGTVNLASFGDVVQHGAQGLVGTLVVEPEGSRWRGPDGLDPAPGSVADVRDAGGALLFREFVLHYQDGLNLYRGRSPVPDGILGDDPEDAGEKAFNYRTEPLWDRVGASPDDDLNDFLLPDDLLCPSATALAACPGPSCPVQTPVFSVPAGTPVVWRVAQASGRSRSHSLAIYDHEWVRYNAASEEPVVGTQGQLSVGVSTDIVPLYGAGARFGTEPGVSLYRDMPAPMLLGGLWGCFVATGEPGIAEIERGDEARTQGAGASSGAQREPAGPPVRRWRVPGTQPTEARTKPAAAPGKGP